MITALNFEDESPWDNEQLQTYVCPDGPLEGSELFMFPSEIATISTDDEDVAHVVYLAAWSLLTPLSDQPSYLGYYRIVAGVPQWMPK